MPRSTAVSVFGILNTAIGALGIIGSFRTIAIFSSRAAANNPVTKDDVREPQFRDIDESAPSYRADHICSFADHWNWSLPAQTMGAESFNRLRDLCDSFCAYQRANKLLSTLLANA